MKADPTMPNTSVTPWAARVSTKASLAVIRTIFFLLCSRPRGTVVLSGDPA